MTAKRPPAHLNKESRRIWRRLNEEYNLNSDHLLLLKVCLEAYDRLQSSRILLAEEGEVFNTPTGFKKPHPALQIEKESRSGFLQAFRMLNLDIEPPAEKNF